MKIETPPLEELMQQWEKDSEVDTTEPGKEILRIPLIHNKYNKYLSLHNLAAKRASLEFDKLKITLGRWYQESLNIRLVYLYLVASLRAPIANDKSYVS